jgi:hypothetical protein
LVLTKLTTSYSYPDRSMAEYQYRNDVRHNSSSGEPNRTLAPYDDVLTELANLHSDRKGVERFQRRFPGFIPATPSPRMTVTKTALEHLEKSSYPLISPRAIALAQTLRELQPDDTLYWRDMLRLVWSGSPDADEYLKSLLSGSRIRFDWKRSMLIYEPENDFERAVYHSSTRPGPKSALIPTAPSHLTF